jgi:hypothetical protein
MKLGVVGLGLCVLLCCALLGYAPDRQRGHVLRAPQDEQPIEPQDEQQGERANSPVKQPVPRASGAPEDANSPTSPSLDEPLPLYGALVLQRVDDFARWRSVFDELMPERKQSGIAAQGVMRGVDDARLVAVWLAVRNLASAKAHLQDPKLRARFRQAGAIGQPQLRLSSNVSAKLPAARPGLHAALLALHFADFSRFWSAFQAQVEEFEQAGIVGYVLGRDVADEKRVYLHLQGESPELLRKYLAARQTQKRWREAGLRARPSVTLVREGDWAACE